MCIPLSVLPILLSVLQRVADPGRFVDDVSPDKDGPPDPPIRRVDSFAPPGGPDRSITECPSEAIPNPEDAYAAAACLTHFVAMQIPSVFVFLTACIDFC
jgi:hypothetical protein